MFDMSAVLEDFRIMSDFLWKILLHCLSRLMHAGGVKAPACFARAGISDDWRVR